MPKVLDEMSIQIGKRIREERKHKGCTLQELADQVNLSTPYLSQIENGRTNININTLEKIGKALNTPVINFFVDNSSSEISVIRKVDRRWLTLGEKASESLLVKSRNNIEIFVIFLEPDSDTIRDSCHKGEEFSYVIKGKVRIILNKHQFFDLGEGDIIHYKSDIPHHWQNLSNERAEILVANTPASF